MMKRVGIKKGQILLSCMLCLIVLGLSEEKANAGFVPSATLPELIQRADIICVGKAGRIQVGAKAMFDTGGYVAEGKPYLVPANKAVADFDVEYVIKGKISQRSIQVDFPKNIFSAGANNIEFTEIQRGQREIIFLTKDSSNGRFSLLAPDNYPDPQIILGKTLVGRHPTEATPLRNILIYLTQALQEKNPVVRLDCLQRIQYMGYLLYIAGDTSGVRSNFKIWQQIRAGLNEPPSLKLEEFVQERILPSVVRLIASPDPVTHDNALLTAAALQDVQVIPALVKLTKAQDQRFSNAAAMALGDYCNPEAERLLISLLKDNVGTIREEAASALMDFSDPLTLPFLVDCLNDSDSTVINHVSVALFEITNEQPPAGTKTQSDYVAFWKNWAAQHQDKIKSLRTQFDTASATHPT